MAILENIRKRTTILILIIGLALFAFIISGIFSNDLGGAKVGSSIAEINGVDISRDDFVRKVEVASRRYGPTASTMQVVNNVYEQEVRSAILGEQIEELGINIEHDQIINFLKTNPSYSQDPQFLNENGVFDANKFIALVSSWKDDKESLAYANWLQTENAIIEQAKQQTYFNYIKAGVGATLNEGKLDYKLATDKVDISYVRVPYTSIVDSSITVSKKEIDIYINDNIKEFEQEASRNIQYVYFQEKASLADETAIKDEVTKLLSGSIEYREETDTTDTIPGFTAVSDITAFLDRNSDIKFDTIYRAKKALPIQFADSLMVLGVGEIYGPYRHDEYFKVSRMVGKKANGSVKASHILIGYEGAQRINPEVTRTKEEAEDLANDLLRQALRSGTEFTQLARDNSDGPSAPQGGDLGYFVEGQMVPKFNDFAFGNSVGKIGLVETDFGFHIIKVDDKEDIVQIATLARKIESSSETINQLFTDATQLEMDVNASDELFATIAEEGNYTIRPVNKLKALDENLPGLTAQRSVVQWAFNDDTRIGDIRRFDINNGHAVVQLTAQFKEGLMSVEDASATVLPILRKKKKAAQIIAASANKSFEDFASSNNVTQSNASALTMKSPTIPGAGSEPAVVGTAFALAQDATSSLIEGETGIFMVKVTGKTDAPELDSYITYANAIRTSNATKVNTEVYNALKENSEIEDNRATFY